MELQATRCGFEDKKLQDHRGQEWVYVSENEMQKHYPNGGYRVMADLKKSSRENVVGALVDGDKSADLFTYIGKLPFGTKCLGYISVVDENKEQVFVRVLQKSDRWIWSNLGALLLLLTIGIGIWLLVINTNNKPTLDNTAIAYHIEGVENKDPKTILMPTISTIKMQAGTDIVEYPLVNTTGNPCYFQFTLILVDTGEILYESGLIEPNMAIPKFRLKRQLEPGIYDMTLYVNTKSLSNPEAKMNDARIEFKLEVVEAE